MIDGLTIWRSSCGRYIQVKVGAEIVWRGTMEEWSAAIAHTKSFTAALQVVE